MAFRFKSPAFRLAALYVVFGVLWIVWSDWLLTLWIDDTQLLRQAQTHKGWFFVLVTGVLLYVLVKQFYRQLEASRQESYNALQESERQLATLMANLPGMAFRCKNDGDWTMFFASKGCEQLTGYPMEEIVSSKVLSYARIIHPEDRRKVLDLVSKKLDTRQHYQLNYRIVTRLGRVKWVRENAVGVFNEMGELQFIEGLIIDISGEKENERIVKEQLIELERINSELDRFATSVSHDLKSPLLAVEGFMALLKQDLEDGNFGGAKKSMARIMNVVGKMHQLLEDLLKLSRLGKVVNPATRIEMNELVEEVLEYLYGIINCDDCHVRVEPSMPAVYADRSRIAVVLQNLIENAVKFRQPGNVPLEILIGFQNRADFPVFFVSDNGIGIDKQHHTDIFEIFTRLDPRNNGTGVGLSLVDRIIRFHGGKVWVESAGNGQGATFFFTLPAKPPTPKVVQ